MANSPGKALNPLSGKIEDNGTSLIDVTDVAHPRFLSHIPAPSAAAPRISPCVAATLCRMARKTTGTCCATTA
jgi:hypothetical protein